MNETIKLGLVLLLVAAIAGGVLAGVNSVTAPVIAERQRQESFGALLEIFSEADDFLPIDEALLAEITSSNSFVTEIMEAKKSGETIGYAMKTKSGGYGGDIITQIGINLDSTIAGIKVMQQSETPGLGSRIVDEPAFADSFAGKNFASGLSAVGTPTTDNEVMALSGATVSTNGVMAGVNGAIEAFNSFLNN